MNDGEQDLRQPVAIPIHLGNEEDASSAEWALIEINGELIQPTEFPDNSSTCGKENDILLFGRDQVELGSLWFDDKEIPRMIVGGHELKGAVEKLKQPFCVLEKENNQQQADATSYLVKGVVTRKLLFSQYPKSILTRT
mmetsp:Transcript_13302/g.17389  ORF Transcript_13302/g.17389 Transcript_13302/m.17389 type:complete len:139 (-) Transcript_13302:1307-1723(-)